jgi:mono/diheme cytochrome c family protein
MRRTIAATVAAGVLAAAATALAQAPVEDPVASMQLGKSAFEQDCRLCHGLDRPLAKRDSPEGWALTVRRMISYGAPVAAPDRPRIVRYLATRSAFAAKCGACHDATRVVPDVPVVRDWKALTARMEQHLAELAKQGKAPAGVAFTPQELGDIAALLQVVIPQ